MKLRINKIKYSNFDLRRGLKFPERLSNNLAEDIGIMIGDGHLGLYKRKNRTDYVIQCSGNLITDWLYYSTFVKNIKKDLFNLNFALTNTEKNTLKFKINSKGLLTFYTAVIKLPLGRKTNIKIPSLLLKDENHIFSCIKGIIDTDGSLVFRKKDKNRYYYPMIKLACSSKPLINQISKLLLDKNYTLTKSLNLQNTQPKTGTMTLRHEIQLNGTKNLEKWIKEIGFSNPKNWLKYYFWKKNGFCLSDQEIRLKINGSRGPFTDRKELNLSSPFEPPTTSPSTASR